MDGIKHTPSSRYWQTPPVRCQPDDEVSGRSALQPSLQERFGKILGNRDSVPVVVEKLSRVATGQAGINYGQNSISR